MLAQEEAWIRRGVEARRTRDAGRMRRLEQLRRERAARRDRLGSVGLAVEEGERSGKLVAELTHVSKAFDGKPVVRDFSCRILRGDKVGLIGPNAAGKTTLIRLILGDLAPDAGRVRLGTKLAIAYFDQFRAQLDEEASVFETVGQGSDYVEVAGARKHVMSYLGDFLFPPERVRSPVKSLSGGERNRLLLARLFAKSANVLVLDEPTNDLDIETLELLEGLLQEYTGTVLLVSHDRAFLDNVVTQVIAYDGDGRWVENPGGYEEWARVLSARALRAAADEASRRCEAQRAITLHATGEAQLQGGAGARGASGADRSVGARAGRFGTAARRRRSVSLRSRERKDGHCAPRRDRRVAAATARALGRPGRQTGRHVELGTVGGVNPRNLARHSPPRRCVSRCDSTMRSATVR